MIAEIRRLGKKRWRARVGDGKTIWHFDWDTQRRKWMLMRAEGQRNRDPELKPLIYECLMREWSKQMAELILEDDT